MVSSTRALFGGKQLKQHLAYFKEEYKKIKSAKDIEVANQEMTKLYKFIKDVTPEYMDGEILFENYQFLIEALFTCENAMPECFITCAKPEFVLGSIEDNFPKSDKIEIILDWIVYEIRKYYVLKNKRKEISSIDLSDECRTASLKVKSLCDRLGLKSDIIKIYPGFEESAWLYGGNGYHCANIIYNGNERYLIDCTYSQFFINTYNNLERIGIIDVSGCRAGIFMTLNEERMNLAELLLKKGWFKITDARFKDYFDGFALSYRNGLYYQSTNDYSYTTNYTAHDYDNFIKGIDSQVKHEDIESLGFQRTLKPTKK